jgi:hypothetical protein
VTAAHYRQTMSVGLVAGYCLAVIFTLAAYTKSRSLDATVDAASVMLGRRLSPMVGIVIVCAEGIAAVLLSVPALRRAGGTVALILLATFSAGIFRSLRAGRTPVCSCFGATRAKPISSADLVRNGALAVLAVLSIVA